MNELFPRVYETDVLHQLRFNGNREAFVNGDFEEFYDLLQDKGVWFNDNVAAYSGSGTELEEDIRMCGLGPSMEFKFNSTESVCLTFQNEPQEADTDVLNMLLEAQVQRNLNKLTIRGHYLEPRFLSHLDCACC
jgi:hypothetical protein